jgi:hypothetical protein
VEDQSQNERQCPICFGTGKVAEPAPDTGAPVAVQCPLCEGAGEFSGVVLLDGPYRGDYAAGALDKHRRNSRIALPVDASFGEAPDEDATFAHAIYEQRDHPTVFTFKGFRKVDGAQFSVEFADGPLKGVRPFIQPIEGLPDTVFVPLPTEETEGGRVKVTAVYEAREHDGKELLFYVQTLRQKTTEPRFIVEYVGGPFDGQTLDSDAGRLDEYGAKTAMFLGMISKGGRTGHRFRAPAPHMWDAMLEMGQEAFMKYGGPFQRHMYEVFEALPTPYETYFRVRYVPQAEDA